MNNKRMLYILFVILALALPACGTAATATPASVPVTVPPSAPTAVVETADSAAIAQDFYKALNAKDIEAAMALVADDVKCRGACYLSGKESFRSFMQGSINMGGRVELSDLQSDGDKVTYTWTAYNTDGVPVALGTETLKIENGLIILMETQTGVVPAAPASDPLSLVQQYYDAIEAIDIDKAMTFVADDYVMTDPNGFAVGKEASTRAWKGYVDAGFTFDQSDFQVTGNRVTSCYKVYEKGNLIDQGCGAVTHVRDGKISFDGLEAAEQIWVVQEYYEALNAQNLDLAMSYIAPDALFINPTGTYEGADAIRESLAGLNTDGITFDLSNFRNTDGKIVYDYKVMQGGNLLDQGTNGLTVVEDGKIVFDGTEDTLTAQ